MDTKKSNILGTPNRRSFLKRMSGGAALLGLGGSALTGCSSQSQFAAGDRRHEVTYSGSSTVSIVPSTDQRDAAYNALKPFEDQIAAAIQGKKVVIKVNMGQVAPDVWLNATDPKFTQGIIDFLQPIYDGTITVAESTAAGAQSTLVGFENYGYMPMLDEYDNVEYVDLNDVPYTTQFILSEDHHPLPVNVINTFLDPDVYLISATRLKTHNCVIGTLSLKNVAMAAPVNHWRQASARGRNEKPLMHSGGNRGLSYNMWQLARLGVQPDLAVLDGVVGMEGDGPVNGTPVEQGVALASTDWVAADRVGYELMGMEYKYVKYLQWCKEAGMGEDDLSKISIEGPDFSRYITKYNLHRNYESQLEWVQEDYDIA